MKKLYQEIQDQINQLMSSKVAKYSDKQLSYIENKISYSPELIDKLILDYQSGISMKKISQKYGISDSQVQRYLKYRNIETRTNYKDSDEALSKRQDILSGMGVHEYCSKWKVNRAAYYKMRKRHKIS